MAALFVQMTERRLDEAWRAVGAADRGAVRDAAHGLRSSCGQFGAAEAVRCCLELEAAAESGDGMATIAAAAARLDAACAAYHAWLGTELGRPGGDGTTPLP
jgi:HPt (histidine-containing phosphotransfer) domain-containing protein